MNPYLAKPISYTNDKWRPTIQVDLYANSWQGHEYAESNSGIFESRVELTGTINTSPIVIVDKIVPHYISVITHSIPF
jgi:hypothetical protein